MEKQPKSTRNILLGLLAFLGLVPGIILFIVLGIAPILLMIALIKKLNSKLANQFNFFKDMHWSWSYVIYTGFALIGWIQIQMVFLSAVNWLHTVYMFLALLIIFVALLPSVRTLYKID
ncbi:MAG: hypothetical protein WKF97_15005 [Chitinophagaceae bacterium]